MRAVIDAQTVAERLGLDQAAVARLAQLEAVGPPSQPFALPSPERVAAVLAQLSVPAKDIAPIVEHMPSAEAHPAEWWLLERCYNELTLDMGGFEDTPAWPALPPERGPLSRLLYLYVFLAATPIVRNWHAARGISDAISWATLSDLGNSVGSYRATHGQIGFDNYGWLTYHYRGGIYRLGRLQFGKCRVSFDPAAAGFHEPFSIGELALGVHVPGGRGLTPAACDAAFEQAPAFFQRHFPDEHYRVAECGSWLLDDQLAEYLPADSNIMRFQRRFQLVPDKRWPADDDIIQFVFGRPPPVSLDRLPQQTTLERAVVQHLQAGRHWYSQLGWTYL
jgi:hypothetical protein